MCFIAKRISKPVKWVESRRENFQCTIHGRGHVDYYELAAKRDGTMLGPEAEAHPGSGRLPPTAHARHSHALRADDAGPVQIPEHFGGHRRRLHQLRAHGRLPRRRPARGHSRHRAHGGHPGRRAEDGSRRDPPEEFRGQRRVPVRHHHRADLRQRQLRRSRSRTPWREVDYTELRARAGRRARGRQADGNRDLDLRRDLRHRSFARDAGRRMGERHGEDRADRQGHRDDRRFAARPGRRDHLRADHGRRAGRRHRRRAGGARRYRRGAVRHRHVRQPRHGGGRRGAVLRAAGAEGQAQEVRRHAARYRGRLAGRRRVRG